MAKMASTKLVHMMFAVGGLIAGWFVLVPTTDWIWGFFDPKPPDLWTNFIGLAVAFGTTFYLWSDEKTFGVASEIATELSKVTWPTRQETKWATVVVIITVFIAAAFLGVFDIVWSWTTSKVYG